MRLDSGCTRTTVRKDLIPRGLLKQERSRLTIADGSQLDCGLADVTLQMNDKDYTLEVAVAKELAVPVLLGRDLPLLELMCDQIPTKQLRELCAQREKPEEELMVVTRSQRRRENGSGRQINYRESSDEDETSSQEWESIGGEVNESASMREARQCNDGDEQETEFEFDFANDLFQEARDPRPRMSKAQKRATGLIRTGAKKSPTEMKTFGQRQYEDSEVQRWMREEQPSRVIKSKGVLFRKWTPREDNREEVQQLVLPRCYQEQVIKLAHSVPIAGHLGKDKTIQRILGRFYWPTVHRDVKKYCQECAECQLRPKYKGARAPMMPLPILGEPFTRMAMDIVGPLPKTKHGNQYILVICDYATRYPEAFPLHSFTAQAVANKLIELFSRHGVPREILTDQGTNLTSALLRELYKMLGVQPIKTTPYHPQTDGLVERFNQTLKSMLNKVIAEDGRNWDTLIPYVLFAYREVPQASTGFSPFELLYGRDVSRSARCLERRMGKCWRDRI